MSRTETIKTHAVRLIANDGFEGMSLRALASACGLQPGSIYTHYRSKQQLLVEVVVEYLEDLLESWRFRKRGIKSPSKQLQVFMAVYVEFQASRCDEQRILQWDLRSLEAQARQRVELLMDECRDELAAVLRAGQAKGQLSIADVATTARMLFGLMMNMCVQAEQSGVAQRHLLALLWRCVQGMAGARLPATANVSA
ncbi:TetR/AcrR family transcriptional regulator [Pseudomonas typographi]|uniref:TetR/AcrR family transcriptional regulator n=1 Tax=Pseudomonas typographi TaxID=2715964 RepID=A0ABR7YY17_9PSED|nr:TetR/AcrR family transcriptional regulator [Pseudomonas typographi]MBD1550440.1 TetR/AcrR family transcriptional regulator [Pseudomonas typographi]MBD1587883.1 TetR/AcrR family transcriptional regulator [Pseudomonas typographi]MBD1598091.1 TetR/AcrR family transcriptional regulator [Pseudomonas typographi]